MRLSDVKFVYMRIVESAVENEFWGSWDGNILDNGVLVVVVSRGRLSMLGRQRDPLLSKVVHSSFMACYI